MSDFMLQFLPEDIQAKKTPTKKTGVVEQGMSGVNEGLAGALGLPVDAATGAINMVTGGFNKATGAEVPRIERPVGGGDFWERLLDFSISDAEPQTVGQRYARRVGREVGYGVPVALTTAGTGLTGKAAIDTGKNLATFLGANAAADVGAGVAGQTSREIAPENDTADLVASLLGGTGTALSLTKASKSRPKAPTRAAHQVATDQKYADVKNSGATLSDGGQGYFDRVFDRFQSEGGDALAFPKANAQIKKIKNNPRTSVYDVEQARRKLRDHVAKSADEASMGGELVGETDDYLRSLTPADVSGANAEGVVRDLLEARRLAHQGIKADEVADAVNRAGTRTSTTGTAGNSLNAQSQEIRKIYDKEISLRNKQKSGGYTPDEVEAMRQVVEPSAGERTLQRVGRLAPGTGGLQTIATVASGAGGAAALMGGNPLGWLAGVPTGAGVISQAAAEAIKRKKIREITDVILRGGKAAAKKPNKAIEAAIASQILNAGQ